MDTRRRSLFERLLDAWPSRWWLNPLVFLAVLATLAMYYLGPLNPFSPPWLVAWGLWAVCLLGRFLVFLADRIRRAPRRRSR
ncbi:MAG TPA: hypothetical protein VJT67_04035 [Longimicrobiaceae bacterium]|nr:hypothetical protein [Longimicrobiaceae bacterium]